MKHRDFSEQVVWITGASSGIGRALALEFAGEGARLILSGRNVDHLEAVSHECGSAASVSRLPFDLSDLDALPAKAREVLGIHGHVDYMVHNAGVAHRDSVVQTSSEIDKLIMSTNYFGPVTLTKALLPSMLERRSGCFVVVSSLSSKYGGPRISAYSASKHALHGFFESLRAEVYDDNIRVTIVIPGFIRTPITEKALTGDGQAYGKSLAIHDRGMSAEECARRIVKATASGKEEALVGGSEMWSVHLKRFFPTVLSTLIRSHPVRFRRQVLGWLRIDRTEND